MLYFCNMLTNQLLSNILIGAFVFIIAVQLFYYLFFFLRLAIYKKKTKQVNVEHPISVVICARDEAHNLANNLPGVLVQQYSTTHEVVLVNDNSEDETKYLIEYSSSMANCVGFNTFGYLKSKIEKLGKVSWFSEKDGIYIKKSFYEKYLEEEKDQGKEEVINLTI